MRLSYRILLAASVWIPAAFAGGTIFVNTNVSGSAFAITGPASYSGTGYNWSQTNAPAGAYSITYGDQTGYLTPQVDIQVLPEGGSITFNGNYIIPGSTGQIFVLTDLPAATFTVSGAGNYKGSGTFWYQPYAPIGTYTVSFDPVAGFPTPRSQTLVLGPNGTITLSGSYGISSQFTGNINVSTDLPNAGFTITGSGVYTGAGTFYTVSNVPTGAYTIFYNAVPGYPTPPSQTLVLGPGGTITFTARYGASSTTGTVSVSTNLANAAFSVTGPLAFNGSGTFFSQPNCPVGFYTISFAPVSGYPTPASQTLYLTGGGVISFTGTYGGSTTSGAINVTTNLAAGSFLLTGPTSYGGNGLSFSQGTAPAGNYTIVYGSVQGYTTPAPQTLALVAGDTITFNGVYLPLTSATGSIFVVTDIPNASFNVTGPTAYTGSGKLFVQANAPPGVYSITFNPVAGYTTPLGQVLSLSAGGNVTFNANYGTPASTGTILVSTNLTSASFIITGADYFQGSGGFWSKTNCLSGTYTITYLAYPGYPTPPPQTFTLSAGGVITFTGNYGLGPSNSTINVTTNMPNATFSIVGPASFSGSGLSFTKSGLTAGTYIITYGTIAGYTAPPTDARLLIDGGALNFNGIYTLTNPLDIPAAPASLNFFYDVGQAVPSGQLLQIATASPVVIHATALGASWLSVNPANAVTPSTMTVSVNTTGLPVGVYTGTIQLTAGTSFHTTLVPVTLTVRPPAKLIVTPAAMTFTYELAGSAPLAQDLFVSASGHNANFRISNVSASWLSVSGTGMTPAKFGISVNPAGLAPGTYTGSIVATSDEAINSPQTTQVTLVVTGVSSQFGITTITNAAYPDNRLAPCSMASVYGAMMSQTTDTALTTPIPFTLGGAKINVNGEPAPFYYASPSQINFQVPCDLGTGTAQVEVNNGITSTFTQVLIQPAAPGIYLSANKFAAATNDDGSVLDSTHPATPGHVLTVYFTGQGLLNSVIATGAAAPLDRLLGPQASTSVMVGKAQAEIVFVGLTPGTVGVAQVNLKVPDLAAGQYPLVLTVGGAQSNAATVPVQP